MILVFVGVLVVYVARNDIVTNRLIFLVHNYSEATNVKLLSAITHNYVGVLRT